MSKSASAASAGSSSTKSSRVSPEYATYAHLDYDEINAAALFGETVGEIILD